MAVLHRTKSTINGSIVQVDIVDDITFEDLVIFKARSRIHEIVSKNYNGTVVVNTYRQIKDWLVTNLWGENEAFCNIAIIEPETFFWNKERVLGITNRKLPAVACLDVFIIKSTSVHVVKLE